VRPLLRIGLAVVGLSLVLYGAASLTGGWYEGDPPPMWHSGGWPLEPSTEPRPDRAWISAAVIAVGLALFAWAAWPRKVQRSRPSV
jgi:hypothetical protein